MTTEQEELALDLSASMDAGDLVNMRNHGFAGAGVSLAMILLIAQLVSPSSAPLPPRLVQALCCSAVALPLWFFFALSYDMWNALKLTGSDLHALPKARKAFFFIALSAILLNTAAVWCLLNHYSELGAGLFVIVVVLGFVFLLLMLVQATKVRLIRFRQKSRSR
jgi:hypothetical protein